MDISPLIKLAQMCHPMILVVTTEVPDAINDIAKAFASRTGLYVGTRFQTVGTRLQTDTPNKAVYRFGGPKESFRHYSVKPSQTSLEVLEDVFQHEQRDEPIPVFFLPDIYVDLDQRDVQLALLQIKDHTQASFRKSSWRGKILVVFAPSEDLVPTALRPYFAIVHDDGMTGEQVEREFRGMMEQLALGKRLQDDKYVASMVEIGMGMSRYQFDAALRFSLLTSMTQTKPGEPMRDIEVDLVRQYKETQS